MENVLEWLERSVGRYPDKTAVADPETSLSFSELHNAARSFGSWLAARTEPRRAVAFYLEKSAYALAAMLGSVYAGCSYTVIDVRQPAGRVANICESLDPCFLVTDADHETELKEKLLHCPWTVVRMEDALSCEVDEDALEKVRAQSSPDDTLYINFTSGSTGTPKGVMIPHRGVLEFIDCFTETFAFDESRVFANQAPFDFDVSVKDIYSCLKTGATLRLVPRSYFTAPTTLMDYLADSQVTTLIWAVSAMTFVSIMNGFSYRVPTTIREVMFSGEVMPPKQLRTWQSYLPDARFVNLYGPTEITCNCSYYDVERTYADDEVIPMGKPFACDTVFLLDENDALVESPDTMGEVCVVGPTLAKGYLGLPEKTAEVFVQNPLETRVPETMYRTGDIARYDQDGNLVYVSRKDNQIKHMGQRIELGDIEASANAVDGVEQSVCLYNEKRKRILLFYVGSIEKDALVEKLRELLPQYMVPNSLTKLDGLPLNKNGKVDRTLLAEQAGIRR